MTKRRLKAGDIVWLLIALILQSTILFLPSGQPQKPSLKEESISVTLDIQSKAYPEKVNPELQQPAKAQQPKPDQIAAAPKGASNSQKVDPKAEPTATPDVQPLNSNRLLLDKSSTRISTAQLLVDASELEFSQQESKKTRKLGDSESIALPVNWLPNLKLEDNLFDDRMLTGRMEIVDQWSGVDGGYNAIVKTASGHTLCGRSQPRNRISSMEASVVMWQLCD